MSKQYQYTIYRADGTTEVLEPGPKKEWSGEGGLYDLIGCQTIEIIPPDYYRYKNWGRCYVYGDEEGRMFHKPQNRHFKPIAPGWDLVGDIIKEEVYHNA